MVHVIGNETIDFEGFFVTGDADERSSRAKISHQGSGVRNVGSFRFPEAWAEWGADSVYRAYRYSPDSVTLTASYVTCDFITVVR